MLEDTYLAYRKVADQIPWQDFDVNEAFRKYIEYENNEDLKDIYFSALMCRVWGYTGRLYNKCNKHIPFDQCYDILYDTVIYVANKRVWENKDSSIYNDPKGPDKAFHMVLKRQLGVALSNFTAQKRKTNFNTLSIDEFKEDYNDAAEGFLFDLDNSESQSLRIYIGSFIDNGEPIITFILDAICYSDFSNSTNKYNENNVLSYLYSLDFDSFTYYEFYYNMTKELYSNTLEIIKSMPKIKLRYYIRKTLYSLRNDWR